MQVAFILMQYEVEVIDHVHYSIVISGRSVTILSEPLFLDGFDI